MKKSLLFLVFTGLSFLSKAQIRIVDSTFLSNSYDYRHTLGIGVFWLPFYRNILLVAPSYDYRTPFFKKNLSVGVAGIYGTTFRRIINEDYSIGVRILYHAPTSEYNDKLDMYIGPGFYYRQKTAYTGYTGYDYQTLRHYKFAYYIGMRLYLNRHDGLQFELSNNRAPTTRPSYSGKMSPSTITAGLTHRF